MAHLRQIETVKVSSNGKLTAIKAGNATITVKSIDGKYSATCLVSVKDKENVSVKSLKISGSKSVTVGSTITLKAVFTPTDASNKKVTWKSSNSKIATVDANGRVKGIAPGKVTITACSQENKDICASISITVNAKSVAKPVSVTSITISGNNTMKYGSSQKLSAIVKPDNASNKAVTWSVSNGATIDQNGNITITGDVDSVTVTATAKDGSGVKATLTITVEAKYSITLDAIDMGDGSTYQNYKYTVFRNGKTFTNYTDLIVNGNKIWSKVSIARDIAEAGSSATMKVNGQPVTLSPYTLNKL